MTERLLSRIYFKNTRCTRSTRESRNQRPEYLHEPQEQWHEFVPVARMRRWSGGREAEKQSQ